MYENEFNIELKNIGGKPLIVNSKWYNFPHIYDVFSKSEDYNQCCVNIIKKYINDHKIKVVNPIDLGSGTGKIYHQLLKKIKIIGDIFLVDNNVKMIEYLNKTIHQKNVKIIKADIKDLCLTKSSFIISFFGFPSCILNKNNILKELKKVYELLLDDGIFITIGWNEKWNDEFFELWKKYLNIDYSNKVNSVRNCNLSWYIDNICCIVKFLNKKQRDLVLGSFFGNNFIKDYDNDNKLTWNISMGITINSKNEIKEIINNWEELK